MTTDERIEKLEIRVEKLEDKQQNSELDSLKQYTQLEKLIAKAVSEGNKEIFDKLKELEDRVNTLENAEAHKALESKKQFIKSVTSVIISVIVTFFGSIILNNLISIIASQPIK